MLRGTRVAAAAHTGRAQSSSSSSHLLRAASLAAHSPSPCGHECTHHSPLRQQRRHLFAAASPTLLNAVHGTRSALLSHNSNSNTNNRSSSSSSNNGGSGGEGDWFCTYCLCRNTGGATYCDGCGSAASAPSAPREKNVSRGGGGPAAASLFGEEGEASSADYGYGYGDEYSHAMGGSSGPSPSSDEARRRRQLEALLAEEEEGGGVGSFDSTLSSRSGGTDTSAVGGRAGEEGMGHAADAADGQPWQQRQRRHRDYCDDQHDGVNNNNSSTNTSSHQNGRGHREQHQQQRHRRREDSPLSSAIEEALSPPARHQKSWQQQQHQRQQQHTPLQQQQQQQRSPSQHHQHHHHQPHREFHRKQDGAWTCPHCSFLNFKLRTVCKQCGKPAPNAASPTSDAQQHQQLRENTAALGSVVTKEERGRRLPRGPSADNGTGGGGVTPTAAASTSPSTVAERIATPMWAVRAVMRSVTPLAHLTGAHRTLRTFLAGPVPIAEEGDTPAATNPPPPRTRYPPNYPHQHIIRAPTLAPFGRNARLRALVAHLEANGGRCAIQDSAAAAAAASSDGSAVAKRKKSARSAAAASRKPLRSVAVLLPPLTTEAGEPISHFAPPLPLIPKHAAAVPQVLPAPAATDDCTAASAGADKTPSADSSYAVLPPSSLRNCRLQLGDWGCGACGEPLPNKSAWPLCKACGNNRYKTELIPYAKPSPTSTSASADTGTDKGTPSPSTPPAVTSVVGRYAVPNVAYVCVVGYSDQRALQRLQETCFAAYCAAVTPLLEAFQRDGGVVVNPLLAMDAGQAPSGTEESTKPLPAPLPNTVIDALPIAEVPPLLAPLSHEDRVDVLFTEPAWFCFHCGLLSQPSPRLTTKLMDKVRSGRVSPFHPYVAQSAMRYRPHCNHCLSHRAVSEAPYAPILRTDMPVLSLPFKDPKAEKVGARDTSTVVVRGGLKVSSKSRFDPEKGLFLNKRSTASNIPGDWVCSCGCLNYRLRRVCSGCGLGRLRGLATLRLSTGYEGYGDWLCSCCLLWNFRQAETCYNCQWRGGTGNSNKDTAGARKTAKSRKDWSGDDAVALGIRADPPATPREAAAENNRRIEDLAASPLSPTVGEGGGGEGNEKMLRNAPLLAAATVPKYTTGHISNALFIVGEDVLPAASDDAIVELVKRSVEAARGGDNEDVARGGRQSPSAVARQFSFDNRVADGGPNFSGRGYATQAAALAAGSDGGDIPALPEGAEATTYCTAIRRLYPFSLGDLGKCGACGHQNRYNALGAGSTCVVCHSVVFPMLFSRWERIDSDAQRFIFPTAEDVKAKGSEDPKSPLLEGLPVLSKGVATMLKSRASLLGSTPCVRCGTYNAELRTRCRRCGHSSRWRCEEPMPVEGPNGAEVLGPDGSPVLAPCGFMNAEERGYCSHCGTCRPASAGEVVHERADSSLVWHRRLPGLHHQKR